MSRLFALMGAVPLAVLLVGVTVQAEDKDKEKIPDIGEIMEKAHGEEGLKAIVTKEVKEKEWSKASKTVKEWLKLSEYLAKNTPDKGSKESWKQKTGEYDKTLKSLSGAIQKKNQMGALGALKKITNSCKTCHTVHKES